MQHITRKQREIENGMSDEDMENKRVCSRCEIKYPLTDDYFAMAHGSSHRRLTICRECKKEYNREYILNTKEEVISEMYTIKEEPMEAKTHRLRKALNYIHLQAFGEQMESNIYWCKKDEHVQLDSQECPECDKPMEKIGFIETNEGSK